MSAPILHSLEFFRNAFPEIQLPDSWVISTSKSDDVIWNIVLSYLNCFPLSDDCELTERLKCLTGLEEARENFKLSIEMCNPFLNRGACFSDKDISNLVAKFKERVKDYIQKDEKLLKTPAKNFGYLEASANLLSCNIVLISLPFPDKYLVNVFPIQTPQNPRRYFPKHISIFNVCETVSRMQKKQEMFSFCIPKDIGLEKKRHALSKILKFLKAIDVEDKILEEVSCLSDITENFLMSLLKNNFVQVICSLYKFPHLLSKLSCAGFETDPKISDSEGKSAFFHALKTEESYLVSLLYDHAVSSCFQTDASSISEILLGLKEHLKLLEKDLNSTEISEKSRSLFRDLFRFNEFQIEICESIDKISLKFFDLTGKEYEAAQRKLSILTILKTYETYFYHINVRLEPSVKCDGNIQRIFKEFCSHTDYFDKLDFTSAVLFFDHLFALKERLMLPDNTYLDIESKFFLFVFFRKYFVQYEKHERFYSVSRWITFQERLDLQRQLHYFKEILEETELSENNIINKLPERDVRILLNIPQIYGEFLLFRMIYYLKAATVKDSLAFKDCKSFLVIERCLQVLGESFSETNVNSVQTILNFALPSSLLTSLRLIYNRLAEIKPHEFNRRKSPEKNMELFEEILKDLKRLKKLLIPIYSIHKYEMKQFFLLQSMKHVHKSLRLYRNKKRGCENQLKSISSSSETERNPYLIPTYSCCMEFKRFLGSDINNLNRNETILDKNTFIGYKALVVYLMFTIRHILKDFKVSLPEKTVKELNDYFWCLESILKYLSKDRKLAKYRRQLLLMLKERKSLFKELQNQKKPTNSVTDKSLIDDSETDGEHLHLKTGDIYNYRQLFKFPLVNYDINEEGEKKEVHADDISGKIRKNIIPQKGDTSNTMDTVEIIHTSSDEEDIASVIRRDNWLLANVYHDSSDYSKVDVPAEKVNIKRKTFIKLVEKILEEYDKISKALFHKFRVVSNENFYFEGIKNYNLMLEGKNFVNVQVKNQILRVLEKEFQHMKEYLENEPNKETKLDLEKVSTGIIKSTWDFYQELEVVMYGKEMDENELELMLKNLGIPNGYSVIPFRQSGNFKKHTKISDNQFEFFRNRIKLLKEILIEENNDIKKLWEEATTLQKKKYLKRKIAQLYLKDPEIQASVEMLLFDFMTVLRSKELKQLWKKTTDLFSGINLRRVLFADPPPLKSHGQLLEPYQLALELVEKMLNLISDDSVLECMQQILEQSGYDFSNFMQIMDNEADDNYELLRDKILEWDNWEHYALLIPSA